MKPAELLVAVLLNESVRVEADVDFGDYGECTITAMAGGDGYLEDVTVICNGHDISDTLTPDELGAAADALVAQLQADKENAEYDHWEARRERDET